MSLWNDMAATVKARNSDGTTSNDVKLIVVAQPYGAAPQASRVCDNARNTSCTSNGDCSGSTCIYVDGGCWFLPWRDLDAHAGRLKRWATANGFGWIDLRQYFVDNCPNGEPSQCTADGIHYDDDGTDIAADLVRRCLQNVDGTSSPYYSCSFSTLKRPAIRREKRKGRGV
jgi:hypothetical protein